MSDATKPSAPASERRLAAIVFTDVVGYSSRMQRDETGTMALVKADFALMSEQCARHGGEVLNAMGDGLLMCFSSAVQAVTCGLQIQSEFGRRRATLPPEQALEHRMGIHIGDVFRQETGGPAGDGVNIAARLEGKAPAGGVCVSQMVYDTVKGKVPMQAVFIGPETFKNIIEPILIWHIAAEGGPPLALPANRRVKARRGLITTGSFALAIGLAIAGYFLLTKSAAPVAPSSNPPSVSGSNPPGAPRAEKTAPPAPAASDKSAAADKSLVVLPLENLSPDPANAFFAEGIHADIIAAVSRLSGLKVISRSAALRFKDSTTPLPEIARALGVAHVLTGSVRRAGDKVRILLELRRASDDTLLWSPTYDRDLKDVLGLQGEVATEVARVLQARQMTGFAASAKLHPTDPQAYDLFLKALKTYWAPGGGNLANMNRSCELFAEIVKRDPKFAWAVFFLSTAHAQAWEFAHDPGERAAHKSEARRSAEAASLLDSALGDAAMSYYLTRLDGDAARGLESAQRAARLLPNDLVVHLLIGLAFVNLGRLPEALEANRRALEIDPFDIIALGNSVMQLTALRRADEFAVLAERFLAAGGTTEHVNLADCRYRLRGELPADVKKLAPSAQAGWLERARRWDDARQAAETALADPGLDAAVRCDLLRGQADALRQLGRAREADESAAAALALAEKLRAADPERQAERAILSLSAASRASEAITAARRYVQEGARNDNSVARWLREQILARVLARAGQTRESVALIKRLLAEPSGLTVPMLRAELDWDKLRADAEFKALLADARNSGPL